jgi:hypothetical protein
MRVLEKREEVAGFIEMALVELGGAAQPRDIAELRELAVDARDAETPQQLELILQQAQNLRTFCEQRKKSSADVRSVIMRLAGGRVT